MKYFFPFLLLLVLSLHPASGQIVIQKKHGTTNAFGFEYLVDETGSLAIDTIRNQKKQSWINNTTGYQNLGIVTSAVWVKLTLRNVTKQKKNIYIQQKYVHVDDIRLYKPQKKSTYKVMQSGNNFTFEVRPVKHRTHLFPVVLRAGEKKTCYLRYKTAKPLEIDLRVFQANQFHNFVDEEARYFWLYYGVMFALFLFSLFLFALFRDKSYLYYAIILSLITLFIMDNDGVLRQFLWPTSVVWANRAMHIFMLMGIPFINQFMRHFIKVAKYSQLIDRIINVVSVAVIGVVITTFFVAETRVVFMLVAVIAGLHIAASTVLLFYLAFFRKSVGSRLMLLSSTPVLIHGLFMLSKPYIMLYGSFLFVHSLHFFTTAQMFLLFFALVYRFNTMENKLKKTEKEYQYLFNNTNDIIFTLDENLNFVTVSKTVGKVLGFVPEEIIGKNFLDFAYSTKNKNKLDEEILGGFIDKLKDTRKQVSFRMDFKTAFLNEAKYLLVVLEMVETGSRVSIFGRASDITDNRFLQFVASEKATYLIDNHFINLEYLVHRITRSLNKFISADDVSGIRLAIREIIVNAIEHGNLNIEFNEKTQLLKENRYLDALHKRQQDDKYRDKKVMVEYTFNQRLVAYRITDEGDGFDYENVLKYIDNNIENLSLSGRGLLVAREIFDVMEFNEQGNSIMLVKYFSEISQERPVFIENSSEPLMV